MTSATEERAALELRIEEAAQWFVQLRSTNMSADDIERWNDWSKIVANQQAFDAITRRWQSADALGNMPLPTLAELEADDYDGSLPVSSQRVRDSSQIHRKTGAFFSIWRSPRKSLAAAAALAAFSTWLVFWLGERSPADFIGDPVEVHETAAGQHRKLELSDGSSIDLGAKTSVSVSYAANRRTVVLDRGEALFHVAHDRQRPFVVVAGQGAITAVGTAFNVRRDDDRVVVSVTEGKVTVAQQRAFSPRREIAAAFSASKLPPVSTTLARGQQVAYDGRGELGAVQRADPDIATAWRDGRLQYRNEPLKYVVIDINRYSRRQIMLGDRSTEELVFTGTVFQDQIDEWLRGLEDIFPVQVTQTDNDHIFLQSRQAR